MATEQVGFAVFFDEETAHREVALPRGLRGMMSLQTIGDIRLLQTSSADRTGAQVDCLHSAQPV